MAKFLAGICQFHKHGRHSLHRRHAPRGPSHVARALSRSSSAFECRASFCPPEFGIQCNSNRCPSKSTPSRSHVVSQETRDRRKLNLSHRIKSNNLLTAIWQGWIGSSQAPTPQLPRYQLRLFRRNCPQSRVAHRLCRERFAVLAAKGTTYCIMVRLVGLWAVLSLFGAFGLSHDGFLLIDHPIDPCRTSLTHFNELGFSRTLSRHAVRASSKGLLKNPIAPASRAFALTRSSESL